MNKKSFTLIELIMVVVITGILAGVVAPFIANAVSYWDLVRKERDVIFSVQLAMNRMVREIREIQNVSSITQSSSTDFGFTRILHDGSTETVRYRQTGNTLRRNSDDLADDLVSIDFDYFEEDGETETSTPADMRMVRIQLVLQRGDVVVTLRSLARFRNI